MAIMLGGFGVCGIPENLIAALVRRGLKNLHTISNNMGVDGFGMGLMLEAGMIASHIGSYVGENRLLESLVIAGRLNLTLVPQGTLANAYAQLVLAYRPSTFLQESRLLSPKARNFARSRAGCISWNER